MERMSTLDAGFYFMEHANMPMHLGALAVFEGPAPSYQQLADLYAAKLPRVPRYRQVVRTAPMQVLRPAWADDEHFEVGYHLRRAVVPQPGQAWQLRRLAEQIYAQPLDRSRPLWEAWLLEGIQAGRWAILNKVHHCVVDGLGGADLLAEIFDLEPDAGPAGQPIAVEPPEEPASAGATATGIGAAVTWPLRLLASAPGQVRQQLPAGVGLAEFTRGLTRSAQRLAAPSAASLNGPAGPDRRWAWATANLSRVKAIRSELGGTVNDVLLAAITRGFRDLLIERGELADGLVVRSLVPVSVRGADERGVITNRLSAVLANLPVAEADPIRRLRQVRDQMNEIKDTGQGAGAELLTKMLSLAPPTLLEVGSRVAFQLPQPLVQTVTTNVPGPQFPLYVLGRRMVEAHPYVPIGGNVRLAIAIFSYLGRISFGITADSSAAPDLDILARGIRRGMAELQARANARRRPTAPSTATRRAGAARRRTPAKTAPR